MFKKSAAPAAAASGYTIAKSLRFRNSASAYLNRTQGSGTNRQKYSYSIWAKWSVTDNGQYNAPLYYSTGAISTDALMIEQSPNSLGRLQVYHGDIGYLETTQVLRDPSAWYHFVVIVDTTQATASNRCKLYINGSQVTSFVTANYTGQNVNTSVGESGVVQYIAKQYTYSPARCFDGYMAEYNLIDGQALTQNSFGSTNSTTGVWQPIAYTGTYGSQGFYLKFTDTTSTTTLCYDYSGNSNNWTPNNISLTAGSTYDSMTDVPTLTSATVANYCTWNAIFSGGTISAGNLNAAENDSTANGTMAISSGKFYWEVTVTAVGTQTSIGVIKDTSRYTNGGWGGNDVFAYFYNGNKYGAGLNVAYGATYTTGDVIGVALDMTGNTLVFYKNGASQGTAFSGSQISGLTLIPLYYANSSGTCTANFGQQPWAYSPPTGFVALNTYNLPTSTVPNGALYMNALTYTGNGSANAVITGLSFKPDLVWAKSRSNAQYNGLFDSNRSGYALYSNATDAEDTSEQVTFNSNGFTTPNKTSDFINTNTYTYVAWNWQAGQGSTSSNTNGSITSTVSVNATAGFSIVTYTGTGANATVGHGLGVAPQFIIVKGRNTTYDWIVYHNSLGNTQYMILNQTAAVNNTNLVWNNTSPTSSVFSLGAGGAVNQSTNTFVAYCWAQVAGFSQFGSYTGNGSADGPFIYTGFRPKCLFIKRTDSTADWELLDTSRDPYNVASQRLYPNLSQAEDTAAALDILSNGFKIRISGVNWNASGGTYIYAAFAENPFKNALAR